MSGKTEEFGSLLPVLVTLDGKTLEVPQHVQDSLPAIRSYLELMALEQQRVVSVLSVDGQLVNLQCPRLEPAHFHRIQAQTISFTDLSRQLIATAHAQVRLLQTRVEAAAMQVLINDWPAVNRLWQEWVPEFMSPVLIIKSLRELCGVRLDELSIEDQQLSDHLAQFSPMWEHIERIFEQQDTIELSNALEQRLGPWLDRLAVFLEKLDEH